MRWRDTKKLFSTIVTIGGAKIHTASSLQLKRFKYISTTLPERGDSSIPPIIIKEPPKRIITREKPVILEEGCTDSEKVKTVATVTTPTIHILTVSSIAQASTNSSDSNEIYGIEEDSFAQQVIKEEIVDYNDEEYSEYSTGASSYQKNALVNGHEKLHMCPYCNKEFAQESNLRQHKRIHLGERPFSCKHCGRKFTQKGNMLRHERMHSSRALYRCKTCNRNFNNPFSLASHRRVHIRQKYHTRLLASQDCQEGDANEEWYFDCYRRHKCPHCQYTTDHSSLLQRHLSTHTGEKHFFCHVCNKGFTMECNLRQHEKIHTGEKPFICSYCERGFNQKSNMERHERIHSGYSPFQCAICDRNFTDPSALVIHERVHTQHKPYKCPHCDYKACQSSTVTRHLILVHTKHYPHKCQYCDRGFIAPCRLKKHLAKAHAS